MLHRLGRRRSLTTAVLVAASLALPLDAAATTEPVTIPDGEWQGVIVGSTTIDFGEFAGGGAYNGDIALSVTAGQVAGTYALTGLVAGAGSGGSGTGEFNQHGTVSGTATAPLIEPQEGSIHLVITVAGHTFDQTTPAPADPFTLALTGGDCGAIVANWSVSNLGMSGAGTVVLTRVVESSTEYTDYKDRIVALQADIADHVTSGIGAAGSAQLAELAERATSLRDSIRRNEECGQSSLRGLATLLDGMIEGLLRFALDQPDVVDGNDLQSITNSAAGSGVVGSGSAADPALTEQLVAEWDARLDGFIAAGDSIGISIVQAMAELLGDAGLAAEAQAALDALR